jgi:hypothetical protein
MNTRVGLNQFFAAAGATVITAAGAWAFVSGSASIDRDPFQFAATMAANAKAHAAQVRVAQVQSRTTSTCPNNPEVRDPLAPTCLGS